MEATSDKSARESAFAHSGPRRTEIRWETVQVVREPASAKPTARQALAPPI
jgi:hypothetical protein